MAFPRRSPQIYLPLIGIGLAALWPLLAYGGNALLFPILLLVVATVIAVTVKPEYGLAIAIAVTPLTGLKLPGTPGGGLPLPHEPFRILTPLIVFGVLFYGTAVRGLDKRRLPAVFFALVALIGTTIVSTFNAIDPTKAASDVMLLLTAAALFIAILNVCQTRDQLLVIVGGAVTALLVVSIHGIGQHYAGVFSTVGFQSGGQTVGRVQGSFGHPNEYAGFVAMLIPFGAAVAATRQLPSRLRLLAGVATIAAVPALVWSYSRGALATMIIGSLVWLVFLRPRLAVKTFIVLALAAIVLAPGPLRTRFTTDSTSGDFALRPELWKSALDIYAESPILGSGDNNFSLAYSQLPTTKLDATQKYLLHHGQLLTPVATPSQYLNTLAEQGVIGFAALLAFFFLGTRTAYRAARARDPAVQGLGFGVGMLMASVLAYGFLYLTVQGEPILLLSALLPVAALAPAAWAAGKTKQDPAQGSRSAK